MANVGPTNMGGTTRWVLDTTAVIKLGMPENETGSSLYIQVKTGGAAPGSFIIKQCVHNAGYSGSDLVAPIWTATADTTPTAAGTAIATGGRIYTCISDGMDTFLVYTGGADGMTLTIWGGGA